MTSCGHFQRGDLSTGYRMRNRFCSHSPAVEQLPASHQGSSDVVRRLPAGFPQCYDRKSDAAIQPRPLWLVSRGSVLLRGSAGSQFVSTACYGISAVIWLCSVEGSFWRQPAALWAASVPPAFPVAFANGIMTHFPLCAADLTTSRDRRRDHLCTRFGPHKECMREGDTPAVAAETAGKGKASAAGRDSGSGYCKNCPLGCLYSRPHVWKKKRLDLPVLNRWGRRFLFPFFGVFSTVKKCCFYSRHMFSH